MAKSLLKLRLLKLLLLLPLLLLLRLLLLPKLPLLLQLMPPLLLLLPLLLKKRSNPSSSYDKKADASRLFCFRLPSQLNHIPPGKTTDLVGHRDPFVGQPRRQAQQLPYPFHRIVPAAQMRRDQMLQPRHIQTGQ